MSHIYILDKNGFLDQTKYYEDTKTLKQGDMVKSFYDEIVYFYGVYELNLENKTVLINNETKTLMEVENEMLENYKTILNMVANSNEEMFEDIKLKNREDPSFLRLLESLANYGELSFEFEKIEFDICDLKSAINKAYFNLSILIFEKTLNKSNKDFFYSLRSAVIGVQHIYISETLPDFTDEDFEEIEENEKYKSQKKSIYWLNSLWSYSHLFNKSIYESDTNYLKEEK